ncbi:MAG: hypothetical protein P8M26_04970 [Gammaproteobacteria bacterium]|nr:hypothetical protein [Gammaproteobacteria bacterium]
MIDTSSLLFTAMFVFALMLIGLVLTALEFKAMKKVEKKGENAEAADSQAGYTRRHSAEVITARHDETDIAETNDKASKLRSVGET